MNQSVPFASFASEVPPRSPLRHAVTAHTRVPEAERVAALAIEAKLPSERVRRAQATARRLIEALRAKGASGAVQGLVREYDLSSREGVALMCLAEALLRIPDQATRDALIRDKVAPGDWRAHVGRSPSLFVNAATWGLVVTGKLIGVVDDTGLSSALTRLIARGGEPVIRKGVDLAIRMMGEQFVTGETIEHALRNSRRLEAKGFRYSYDMLGEAATTAADAQRFYREYERAIHAIGRASAGRGIHDGPGISVKLSALHPRYARPQRARVMAELLPRLLSLARLAKSYGIGLNIDAEEAERLELSLDLLEALCAEPSLAGWDGIGFVVQAYQKRAPFVLEWLIDLARRSGHRLMVRLVKGAYWDSEIKRAQVDGLHGFPVFTRKLHTDVSYLACARILLAAPDEVFPQFATHNAYTVAAIHEMAGEDFHPGRYEFQCLHGMGEPLYEEVVGPGKLDRPCRIYAPVGTHETLLAYLVRRLLENGANSSFVSRIQDESVSVDELAADPVTLVEAETQGAPHQRIAHPHALFGRERRNAAGIDLGDEHQLGALATVLLAGTERLWRAGPPGFSADRASEEIRNPADQRDLLGYVVEATDADVDVALARASAASWGGVPATERASILLRAADLLEARAPELLGLLVREAGKSLSNAVAEVREAVDFLRYYAAQVRDRFDNATHRPLGPVVCISPWNFPLAIFTGQIAAALAAGNPVLAKPAEETPLIAAQAVAILHEAGVAPDALQLLPGRGKVGARLVADPRTGGVLFTGSIEVARLIQRNLSERLNPNGAPVPLIAETGGQNALIVDSSALAEHVVADVLTSAFDSAGQRCSALRVLCLQEDAADRILGMIRGALAELRVGNPDRLATDIGPVISEEAREAILGHIAAMRARGRAVHRAELAPEAAHGIFVPPTIIEIEALSELEREVFGPVLHVLRFKRDGLDALIEAINGTGYGLTFGVHTRIGETATRVAERAGAGNVYVNRNLVGAVVGVQPFGGRGLSGTGPKAGGPLYLRRLLSCCPPSTGLPPGGIPEPYRAWAASHGDAPTEPATPLGVELILPGPVGEDNLYSTVPRGTVLCVAPSAPELERQIEAALLTGNRALIASQNASLPRYWEEHEGALSGWVENAPDLVSAQFDAVLYAGDTAGLKAITRAMAERPGPIVSVHVPSANGHYPLEWLVHERSISVNTTAAGGNAHLMMLG